MTMRALLVGINSYATPSVNLRGCHNDVDSLSHLLRDGYAFSADQVGILKDNAATRAAILSSLQNLAAASLPGDALIFGFSGHGTQMKSSDPNEPDGKDECLVTYEASLQTVIRDNEIYELLSDAVGRGVRATCIYDCCHAGTMLKTMIFSETGEIVEDVTNRFIDVGDLEENALRTFNVSSYHVLSACQAGETAADVRRAGAAQVPRGAFSYALHSVLRERPGATVAEAADLILEGIKSVTPHQQNPDYVTVDQGAPLIWL